MSKRAMGKRTRQIHVRLSEDEMVMLDAEKASLESSLFGLKLTRSDAIRNLIIRSVKSRSKKSN